MAARLWLILTLLASLPAGATVSAQTPRPAATLSTPVGETDAANPLPDLPRLADEPRSLFAPAPPPGPAPQSPGLYFEDDPRLNPPEWGTIGWFANVESDVVHAHVINNLHDTFLVAGAVPTTVALPSAALNWTGEPRVDIGYRLGSGFGEFFLSYRFLVTEGSQGVIGPDGPAGLKSRFDLNVIDCNYASHEITLFPEWLMKWHFGVRYMSLFFDSQELEPFTEAVAGSGIFASGESNSYWGIGPDWGLDLSRRLGNTGFSIAMRGDGAILLGRIRQGFFADSTAVGPAGLLRGADHVSSSQAVPMFDARLGVSWKPDPCSRMTVFAGYEYEHWWNVGRESSIGSFGHIFEEAIVLRAEFNF